jgi:hypothetical protein
VANEIFQFFRGNEFNTFHNINNEFCEMFGVQVFYFEKALVSPDYLYGEDALMKFEHKHEMTLYVVNTGNWEGPGDIYAKFGLEYTDEAIFTIQKDKFTEVTGLERPCLGDLLYLPWTKEKNVLQISHADPEAPFYHLGDWSIWTIKAKRFQFSREDVSLQLVDSAAPNLKDDIAEVNDLFDDVPEIVVEIEEESIIDTTESDPFGG